MVVMWSKREKRENEEQSEDELHSYTCVQADRQTESLACMRATVKDWARAQRAHKCKLTLQYVCVYAKVADDVCGPSEKKRTLNRADDYKEEGEGGNKSSDHRNHQLIEHHDLWRFDTKKWIQKLSLIFCAFSPSPNRSAKPFYFFLIHKSLKWSSASTFSYLSCSQLPRETIVVKQSKLGTSKEVRLVGGSETQ